MSSKALVPAKLLLFLLVMGSCSTLSPMTQDPEPPADFPAPATALSAADREVSVDNILKRKGYDAIPGMTHNWSVDDVAGRFSPVQFPGTSAWPNAAFAIYELTPVDYSGPSVIRLRWDSVPADYSELWFGLANFVSGRWEWHAGTGLNQYFFYGHESEYLDELSGRMLIALVLCGQNEAVLARVAIGFNQADDWSMVGRDQRRQSRGTVPGPLAPTLKWKYECGSATFSSPVLAPNGMLYFGSNSAGLQAVRPDGVLSWSFDTGATGVGSPAVGSDGTVYMGAADGNIYALHPDGTVAWSYPTESNIVSSPAIDPNGRVYCGSNDGKLYVLKADGSLAWSAPLGDASHEGAAIDLDGNVYLPCWDNYMYAFGPDGSFKWSQDSGNLMYQHPVVGDQGELYVACWDNRLLSLALADGALAWDFDIGEWQCGAPALAADGTIYAPSSVRGIGDKSLYALDPDGAVKWSYSAEGMFSTPVVDLNGDIYFVLDDGRVISLDSSGAFRWEFAVDGGMYGTPALGADGTLYVLTSAGSLYAIGPGAGLF
ncbi:PQQ-like beta-propeller repeat protein [bacterium]|nr:PQQ-like beta-propeller repeat protein [bacterium]